MMRGTLLGMKWTCRYCRGEKDEEVEFRWLKACKSDRLGTAGSSALLLGRPFQAPQVEGLRDHPRPSPPSRLLKIRPDEA
jgi:hypothetical protein